MVRVARVRLREDMPGIWYLATICGKGLSIMWIIKTRIRGAAMASLVRSVRDTPGTVRLT
jgi:hypothetical protein